MANKRHIVSSLVGQLTNQLSTCMNQSTAQQHAWWLLEAVTKNQRSTLLAKTEITLTDDQQKQLDEWVQQIVHEEKPIAYLIGSLPFCNLELLIEPPILIPRIETEEWVANLIEQLKKSNIRQLSVLDIGTGSGCIALAIAKALPEYSVTGVDINTQAINLAQKNARLNKITNVTFIHADLFQQMHGKKVDLIVSNPPYIARKEELDQIEPSVIKWEDPIALFAEDQGDAIVKKIVIDAPAHLTCNQAMRLQKIPQLFLEVGYQQAHRIKAFMLAHGYDTVTIAQDSFGNDRVVSGSLASCTGLR